MHADLAKRTYRNVFLALQADAKRYPGGIAALAHRLGCRPEALANQLSPDHEILPPAFWKVLEIINETNGKSTAFAVAQLAGQSTIDIDLGDSGREKDQIINFLNLVETASNLMREGSHAAGDLRFDANEKRELQPLLLELAKSSLRLYRAFND